MGVTNAHPVLFAHWGPEELDVHGGKGVHDPGSGRYVFEGDFPGRSAMVNVEVDAPWRHEETALEVEVCLTHPNYTCPEGSDAAWMNCKLVKRVVHARRWQPLVRDVEDGKFMVEIWRSPLAPEDGSAAVGETVLADVGFSVMVLVPQ